jgi:hypothetical protein
MDNDLTTSEVELLRSVDPDFTHTLMLHNDASMNIGLMARIISAVRTEVLSAKDLQRYSRG